MKKIVFLLVAAILATMVFAQDRTMSELKVSQLPKGVTDYISKNLPGAPITRAGKIEEKGEVTYVATVDVKGSKHTYLFDKNGTFKGKGDHLFNQPAKPAVDKSANTPGTTPAALPPVKTGAAKTPAADAPAPKK